MLQRKDIAKLIGISITLLIHWEKEGFLPSPTLRGKTNLWSNRTIYDFCKSKHFVRGYAKAR